MGLVLWIDDNTFSTSLLERVFKKKGLPFYTLTGVDDFLYLVNDLRPVVLVIDSKTAKKNLPALQKQSAQWGNIPVILVEEDSELDFLNNRIGMIKRPFDPFDIPKIIENLLKTN